MNSSVNQAGRARVGMLAVAFAAVVVLILVLPSINVVRAPEIGKASGPTAFRTLTGWQSNLASLEQSYCLTTVDGYTQWSLNGTTALMNVTYLGSSPMGGGCTQRTDTGGVAVVMLLGGVAKQVYFGGVNNTTTSALWNLGNVSAAENMYSLLPSPSWVAGITIQQPYNCNSSSGGGQQTPTVLGPSPPCPLPMVVARVPGWASGSTGSQDNSQGNAYGGCPLGGTNPYTYWWDNVCNQKNYPILYPHADRAYYQIYTTLDQWVVGNQLWHQQLGTNTVGAVGSLGAAVIGALIGAVIGGIIGKSAGAYGALIGALIGAIVGAAMVWLANVIFQDEAQCIWFWVNLGYLHSYTVVPWWVAMGGTSPIVLWTSQYLKYLRVGNTTFRNLIGVPAP